MTKKVYIVHGWGSHPNEGWFPWLKRELEKRNFIVKIPLLPIPDKPRIYNWIPALSKSIDNPNKDTYLIGHSLGCQTIARYLEKLTPNIKVGGVVFVAGFFKRLTGLENDLEVQKTDKHWLNTPIDFKKVRSHIEKSVAIFSDNDPYVPLENQVDFREKLRAKISVVHNKGHFSGDLDNTTNVPVVLKELLEISKSK